MKKETVELEKDGFLHPYYTSDDKGPVYLLLA